MIVSLFLCIICFCYAVIFGAKEFDIPFMNDVFVTSLSSNLVLALLFLILFSNFIVELLRNKTIVKPTITKPLSPDCNAEVSKNLLYLVSLMQEKGRLLDFTMDDISKYSDEDVGRVARIVHQGVREVLDDVMQIKSIHSGVEGEKISLGEDVDFSMYKVIGTGIKKPPFSGIVIHKGWKAEKMAIPKISFSENQMNFRVIQAVEIEVK